MDRPRDPEGETLLSIHLFGGDTYYAQGASGDYLGSFESIKDALAHLNEHHPHTGHVARPHDRTVDWAELLITDHNGLCYVGLEFSRVRPFKSITDLEWQVPEDVTGPQTIVNARLVKP